MIPHLMICSVDVRNTGILLQAVKGKNFVTVKTKQNQNAYMND